MEGSKIEEEKNEYGKEITIALSPKKITGLFQAILTSNLINLLLLGGSQDLLEPIPREEMLIDNSYVCNFCNEKYKNYYQLKTHMRQHKDEQV